jgi:DNA-directed RNA polymerase II subunit RPB1
LDALIQVDESDFQFVRAQKIKNPARKFKMIWNLAKGKTICTAGDDSDPTKHNHGGCGQRQPVYRKNALKLSASFKSFKDEVHSFDVRMGILLRQEL